MGFFSKISSWLGAKPSDQAPEAEAQAVQESTEATPERPSEGPAAPPDSSTIETVAPHLVSQDWEKDLTLALRQAEPKLSVWLGIILQDVRIAGPDLWQRLHFLFLCLEAPKTEADDFIAQFEKWLASMGYQEVEEFRSELQYRLALALDLEDEEDERCDSHRFHVCDTPVDERRDALFYLLHDGRFLFMSRERFVVEEQRREDRRYRKRHRHRRDERHEIRRAESDKEPAFYSRQEENG